MDVATREVGLLLRGTLARAEEEVATDRAQGDFPADLKQLPSGLCLSQTGTPGTSFFSSPPYFSVSNRPQPPSTVFVTFACIAPSSLFLRSRIVVHLDEDKRTRKRSREDKGGGKEKKNRKRKIEDRKIEGGDDEGSITDEGFDSIG